MPRPGERSENKFREKSGKVIDATKNTRKGSGRRKRDYDIAGPDPSHYNGSVVKKRAKKEAMIPEQTATDMVEYVPPSSWDSSAAVAARKLERSKLMVESRLRHTLINDSGEYLVSDTVGFTKNVRYAYCAQMHQIENLFRKRPDLRKLKVVKYDEPKVN